MRKFFSILVMLLITSFCFGEVYYKSFYIDNFDTDDNAEYNIKSIIMKSYDDTLPSFQMQLLNRESLATKYFAEKSVANVERNFEVENGDLYITVITSDYDRGFITVVGLFKTHSNEQLWMYCCYAIVLD